MNEQGFDQAKAEGLRLQEVFGGDLKPGWYGGFENHGDLEPPHGPSSLQQVEAHLLSMRQLMNAHPALPPGEFDRAEAEGKVRLYVALVV